MLMKIKSIKDVVKGIAYDYSMPIYGAAIAVVGVFAFIFSRKYERRFIIKTVKNMK